MNAFVTDTHALFWSVAASPLLGHNAKKAFLDAEKGEAVIHVSAMVLCELFYMNRKFGLHLDLLALYDDLKHNPQFVLHSIRPEDALEFKKDLAVPEMHDRIIVGLARRLGATLITKDSQIIASNLVPVLW